MTVKDERREAQCSRDWTKEIIFINPDSLVTADAVLLALKEGKCAVYPSVAELIRRASYGPSDYEFCVMVETPTSLGFERGCTLSEVFNFAKRKHGLKLLSEQEVFRLRCSPFFREERGQIFFAATEPIFYKGRPYLYSLERFVADGHSSLSNVSGDQNQEIFPSTKILFRFPE